MKWLLVTIAIHPVDPDLTEINTIAFENAERCREFVTLDKRIVGVLSFCTCATPPRPEEVLRWNEVEGTCEANG